MALRLSQESKPGGFDYSSTRKFRASMFGVIVVLLLICHLSVTLAASSNCLGLNTMGTTYPPGDILLLDGDPLDIWCILQGYHLGYNSSNLVFYQGTDKIESEFVTVVNDSTIKLHIPKPPLSHTVYYCQLVSVEKNEAVCLNNVVVGTVPQRVTDFHCESLNWQNLTCNWRPPHNYLKTTYSLTYKLSGRGVYECPHINQTNGMLSCFWDQSTSPPYRQAHEYYTFQLTGSNKFGNYTQEEIFHHYAWVKPSPPVIEKVNKTTSSVYLKWKIPSAMKNFPPGLVHKVIYRSVYDDNWLVANFSKVPISDSTVLYNLTSLKYAYTWYDVRVYLKSGLAVSDDVWSEFGPFYFQTKSKPPSRPPETHVGSFEVSTANDTSREIFLYWKQIQEYEKNGSNFTYKISSIDVNGIRNDNIVSSFVSSGYAVFKNAPLKSLKFTIASSNAEGDSEKKSLIQIPDQSRMVPQPLAFTKIAFDNGLYELSWRAPSDMNGYHIDSYTVFWCDNDRGDRPYQCEGQLNYTTVDRSVTILNVTVTANKIFQFSISANSGWASSGMVWADCTAIPNKVVGKMKNVWINKVGSTFIELRWHFDCSERIGTINGYRLFFCPIDTPHTGCKGPDENVTISGNSLYGNVTNLKPYTTYRLKIAVITMHGDGLQSDPLFNTTLEGAPSEPTNVVIFDVDNTKMRVSWYPPENKNGVVRFYKVNYNNKSVNVDKIDNRDKNAKMTILLNDLMSYTNYTVSVEACTVRCSLPSSEIIVRTAIGKPGIMDKPMVQSYNSSAQRVLTWSPPFYPGGTIDVYEVQVIQSSNDGRNVTQVYNTTALEFVVPAAVCQEEGTFTYEYSVRAVNYDSAVGHGVAVFNHKNHVKLPKRPTGDNSTDRFVGLWSQAAVNNCYSSQASNAIVYWIMGGAMMVVVSALFIIGSKRLWIQYKTMQDIGVSLPPGLESMTEKEPTKYPLGNWGSQVKHGKDEKSSFVPSADEVSLLPNKTLANQNKVGRDLNGFNVNTGNANLSLVSSRVPLDSCKDKPILQDGDQSEPQSANSSLRLRNTNSGTEISSEQASWLSPYTKRDSTQEEALAHYTTVGAWSGNDYFSLESNKASQNESPAGYISFGTFDKDSCQDDSPNESYNSNIVDFNPVKTVGNNSNGYVTVPPVALPNKNYTKSSNLPPENFTNNGSLDLPIGYIKTAPEHVIGLPSSAVNGDNEIQNDTKLSSFKVPPGYVRVDELPMNTESPAHQPLTKPAGQFPQILNQSKISNRSSSEHIPTSDCVFNADKTFSHDIDKAYQPVLKGYVGLQDPILFKQTNIALNEQAGAPTLSVASPEGYCRFGWDRSMDLNLNSPLNTCSSIKEIGSLSIGEELGVNPEENYSSLIDDIEYDDSAEECSNTCNEVRPVNDSYLPLNLSPIRH